MNSYGFDISGSWWLFAFLFIAILAFTLNHYKYTVPPISEIKRKILIGLRSLALAILIFLLFEPLVSMKSGEEILPKIAIFFDNSKSMALSDAKGDRKAEYLTAIENSGYDSFDEEDLEYYVFGHDIKKITEFTPSMLDFSAQSTNLSQAVSSIKDKIYDENIQAVLLFTDGAYNEGTNPIYALDDIAKPVFTVGIGDSTFPKDASIQSILTNDKIFVETPVPVNVNVLVSGYEEEEIKVKLQEDGELIDEQTLTITEDVNEFSAVFSYTPEKEGVKKLTATIEKLDGELTLKNNKKSEYIEVLKNKKKISIFAGAPSHDVSFIYNILNDDKKNTVKSFVQKDKNSFYEAPPTDLDFKETEIFVLIGFPNNITNQGIINKLKEELEKGKSILFIASKDLNYNRLRAIEEYLPFNTISSKQNEFLVLADINKNESSNPILELIDENAEGNIWNILPPIFRTELFVKSKPEANILSYLKVNSVPLKEPLIITRSVNNQKSLAVNAYGLYRWKLLTNIETGAFDETQDYLTQFINNAIKWLSIDFKDKLLSLKTSKKHYLKSEKIEFIGQAYDQSLNPLDDAIFNVEIKGTDDKNSLLLTNIGNGRYTGEIEGLSDGEYFYNASVYKNEKKIGSVKGRFSVGELEWEYYDIRMKSELMKDISSMTNGKFYTQKTVDRFVNDVRSLPNFKSRFISFTDDIQLWNIPWLIALALLLLSIEWFVRKRSGML